MNMELFENILESIIDPSKLKFNTLRENILQNLIYKISVNDFIWYLTENETVKLNNLINKIV